MHRLLLSTSNVFISLVLGAIAFGFVFIKYPVLMDQILNVAGGFKTWLTTRGLDPAYNNWVRVLLEERQLVFMFFTVVMRVLLSLATWLWFAVMDRVRA